METEAAGEPGRRGPRERDPRAGAAPGPRCEGPGAEQSAPDAEAAGPSGCSPTVAPSGGAGGAEPEPGEKKEEPEATDITSTPTTKAEGAPRKRAHKSPNPRKSPKRTSPRKRSCEEAHAPAPSGSGSAPRPSLGGSRRRSWRRSSLKGRKTLPPFDEDVAELSRAIDPELPETERLSLLLQSCFQFSAQKLESSMKDIDGFDPEVFRANVKSASERLKQHLRKLELDGTLRSYVEEEEDPEGTSVDPALEESVSEMKEHMDRFTTESQAWDQLLLEHQKRAEEMSRRLQECRVKGSNVEPESYLGSSQAEFIRSKPNYQKILDDQKEVFNSMELVLDEMLQVSQLLRALMDTSEASLRNLSGKLAARTFRHLERSPVRKLLAPRAAPRAAPSAEVAAPNTAAEAPNAEAPRAAPNAAMEAPNAEAPRAAPNAATEAPNAEAPRAAPNAATEALNAEAPPDACTSEPARGASAGNRGTRAGTRGK